MNEIAPVFTDVCKPSNPQKIISDFTKTYLTTRFYKTIPYVYSDSEVWGAQYNYNNYDIFCLTKNLEPIFSSIGLTFETKSIHILDKMVMCVIPYKDTNLIEMDSSTQNRLQEEVNYVSSELYHLTLLYDPTDDDENFPKEWIINVFPYLSIDSKYNPKFLNGKLYVSLNELDSFNIIYEQAYDELTIQLADFYINGIISCSLEFAKKWDLIEFRSNLYIPKWNDNRITDDRANFLIKICNTKIINIQTLPDLLLKHFLTSRISKDIKLFFNADNGNINFKPNNIQDLHTIIDLIDEYKNTNIKYTIYTIPIANINKFKNLCAYAKSIYPNVNCVYYNINNSVYRYMASIVLYEIEPEMQNKLQKLLL